AWVSRSRVFELRHLQEDEMKKVLQAALTDLEHGYAKKAVEVSPDALEHLVQVASGDARAALNALELAVETTPPDTKGIIQVHLAVAEESIQQKAVLYDKDGDAHYDTISAFIKSVRGSDPDAALYWMAKMVYAGEDPRFIFRRMVILASEDVGMADPHALGVVMNASRAYDYVGLPEGKFHLAQACLYLATAPKSNTAFAFFDALAAVSDEQEAEVPLHLRDASRDGDQLGHGKGYRYPHAYQDHWVTQHYLPPSLQGKVFYRPTQVGHEARVHEEVMRRKEQQLAQAIEHISPSDAKQGLQNRWLDRVLDQGGEGLGQLRTHLLDKAHVGPQSVILDLSGGTGFLTWEACRRAKQGGVYCRCHDETEQKAMEEWARYISALNRPQLFRLTDTEDLASVSDLASPGLRFGAAFLFAPRGFRRFVNWIPWVRHRLEPDCSFWLTELAREKGQRLSSYLEQTDPGYAELVSLESRYFAMVSQESMIHLATSLPIEVSAFRVPTTRTFSRPQVEEVLLSREPLIHFLRTQTGDWNTLQSSLRRALLGEKVWNQCYRIYQVKADPPTTLPEDTASS
ncbi:MAG: hypothetical protein F6K07_32770, partial [Okeania sp. SIO1H5]|nr:hypothetical protein [Okeania sp. SIO1H5]